LPEDWFVNPQVLGSFYEKFKAKSPEEINKFSFDQGLELGRTLAREMGIETRDLKGLSTLLRAVLKHEPTAKIIEMNDKVLLRNSGFCPLMVAATSLNLPWSWFCEVLGWPFFHGLASAVNPKVDLKMIHRRAKGDPYCDHLFELGEGRLILP
jgi:hypothetical protein